ncbi:MAG: N-acetyl sugar amidotransferase [Candidatus Woesearchaeota archaeon]
MEILPYKYHYNKQICSRCVMDDTVPGIQFDENGICTFCKIHDELEQKYPLNDETPIKLKNLIEKIKKDGNGKKYDCIVGVSGGRDSTYTLYNAVKLGLRPLAVHFDNGWNSELAVQNIRNACQKLGVDLHTHVADWEEFKDLQRAFLLASVPDGEVPTDWVITSVLFKVAYQEKLKYFIGGHSFRTEGTTPLTWTYQDGKYVKSIQKLFGEKQIKSFPIMNMWEYIFYSLYGIRYIRLLYYLPYNEKQVLETLSNELNWKNYGSKHFESTYTTFYQSYILTRKFNIDKRKIHYSALIRSGQLLRNNALELLQKDPFEGGLEMIEYNIKKLGLSSEEFEKIMKAPVKSFKDYPSYFSIIKRLELLIKFGTKLHLIPEVITHKYFSFNY